MMNIYNVQRSGSAMAYAQHFPVGNVGALRRAESFHSTVGRRIQSPPYQGNQGYPHSMYQVVVKPPRKGYNDPHHQHPFNKKLYFDYGIV